MNIKRSGFHPAAQSDLGKLSGGHIRLPFGQAPRDQQDHADEEAADWPTEQGSPAAEEKQPQPRPKPHRSRLPRLAKQDVSRRTSPPARHHRPRAITHTQAVSQGAERSLGATRRR